MPYAEVEPDEIRARLARGEDVFLLDVREPDEVAEWAYPIGINIPLGQLGDRLDEVPEGRTIVVACHARWPLRQGGHGAERGRLDRGEPDRRGERLDRFGACCAHSAGMCARITLAPRPRRESVSFSTYVCTKN